MDAAGLQNPGTMAPSYHMTQLSVRALVQNIVSCIVIEPREERLNHKCVSLVGIGPYLSAELLAAETLRLNSL